MNTLAMLRLDGYVRLLALVGILILGNYLAHDWFARLDLTDERVYSLSDASKKVLEGLTRPVEVKAYFTKDLQAPYNQFETEVKDKLDAYRAYSGGKVRYEFKDPTGDPELEEEARRFGIFSVKVDYRAKDQREIRKAFMGVAFVSGDQQESLPLLKSLESLEYDLTRSIAAAASDEKKKKVAFLTGHNEPDLLRPPQEGGASSVRLALEEKYEVATVNTAEDENIPDDVDVLLAFAPITALTDRDLYLLDQFLMAGKAIGFFLANHTVDPRKGQIVPIEHNAFDLLGHFGLVVGKDLVIDRKQNGQRQFPVRQGRMVLPMLINYPLIPVATDLSKESVITRELEALAMPFTSSVTVSDAARQAEGARVVDLIRSSPDATRQADPPPPYDPMALQTPGPSEEAGPFSLAVSYQGPLTSYFKGKPVPPELQGHTTVDAVPIARVVVFGGAEWVQGGFPLLLNAVDWLAQDDGLISIRTRAVATPPLDKVEEPQQNLIQLANVAGVPLAFVLVGILRWTIRARRKE